MTDLNRNNLQRRLGACIAAVALTCIPAASFGLGQNAAATTNPDNSANNQGQRTTADQQSGRKSDLMITKKIRQSLIADKSLSMYGHNVKIITRKGAVTLKGPVHSEEEKKSIASKAEEVVGSADKVNNQLTIKD